MQTVGLMFSKLVKLITLNKCYINDWVASFLSGRSHCTKVGNGYSSFQHIYSGVVQGSCLGPLLFLVYISDVLDIFQSPVNCKLYADDVKLYTELKTTADESCFQVTYSS